MLNIKNLEAKVDNKHILNGLNLDIKPGEVHAIMGPNGSGKSTLSNILSGKKGYDVTGEVSFKAINEQQYNDLYDRMYGSVQVGAGALGTGDYSGVESYLQDTGLASGGTIIDSGFDADGNPSNDPAAIAKGVLLPFGGYKGSAIALMVELLAAGLTGEQFSYEARESDNKDGGPPRGGEMIIGMSPDIIAGPNWQDHVEAFMQKITSLEGVRLPGARRHKNRQDTGPRQVNAVLVDTIKSLL